MKKFKENFKRFWSLQKHSTSGFTLVELIVVIAILAILAGIAVPAYSGYVEKANKAADEQLLASVNTAFASACAVNGEDQYKQNASTTKIILTDADNDGDREVIVLENANEAIVESFNGFFEGGEFKKITNLLYDASIGGFKDLNAFEELILSYAGGVIILTNEQLSAMKNSTFLEKLTSDDLLTQVDEVAEMAKQFDGAGYTNISNSSDFLNYFADALDIDSSEFLTTAQEMARQNLLGKGYAESEITATLMQNEIDKFKANAMVLYTAKNSADLTATDAKTLLTGITASDISQNMQSTDVNANTTGLAQAALAYGMYYSYVNSDACTDPDAKNNVGVATVTQALEDQKFQEYLASEQGTKDMEGYLAAMQMINSSASIDNNADAVESLIINGYNNQELKDLIGSVTN